MENLYQTPNPTSNSDSSLSQEDFQALLQSFLHGNGLNGNPFQPSAVANGVSNNSITDIVITLINSGGLAKLIDAITRFRVATAQINAGMGGFYGQANSTRRNDVFAQFYQPYAHYPPPSTYYYPPPPPLPNFTTNSKG